MLEDLKLAPCYDGFLFLAESARNPPSLRSHHHVELELNLVASGSITYVAGGKRTTFSPRTLLWMFPAQEHQLVDRSKDARNFVAVFKPEMIERSCRTELYRGLKRKRPPGGEVLHTVLDPGSFDFLRRVMERIMDGSLDADLLNREAGFGFESDFRYRHGDPDALNAGLHYLLLVAWKFQQTGTSCQHPVPLHPAVSQALQVLSSDEWNGPLSELAGKCGLSEAHLSRLFARQVGIPFNRYRNSLRLARFWEAYGRPVRPTIMEAVYEAGFGSYAQFYKVFVDSYGAGPRTCLKSHSLEAR